MKNMKKINLMILAFMPLVVELILLFTILFNNFANIKWIQGLLSIILLISIGVGIISYKKVVNNIVFISLIIYTILYSIMGYYDCLQWTSTILATILFIYFTLIKLEMKKL